MRELRVLVAYGARNGGTAEIARRIGATLTDEGPTADVRAAGTVRDVTPCAAVVLGPGVHVGRRPRGAVRFARRHLGPPAPAAAAGDPPAVPGVRRVADRVDACGHVTLGGRLVPGARGVAARMIVSRGRGADWRDEQRVRARAGGTARRIAARYAGV